MQCAEVFLSLISRSMRATVGDGFCWNYVIYATLNNVATVDHLGRLVCSSNELRVMRQAVGATLQDLPQICAREGYTPTELNREISKLVGDLPTCSTDRYADFCVLRAACILNKRHGLVVIMDTRPSTTPHAHPSDFVGLCRTSGNGGTKSLWYMCKTL